MNLICNDSFNSGLTGLFDSVSCSKILAGWVIPATASVASTSRQEPSRNTKQEIRALVSSQVEKPWTPLLTLHFLTNASNSYLPKKLKRDAPLSDLFIFFPLR